MPSTVQVDAQGRLKINAQGMVLLADEGDPCCCGGGVSGEPCECVTRVWGECPGDAITECASALEYDAHIEASGSVYASIDPDLWRFQTNSQSGLFQDTTGFAVLPSPPPTDGVLAEHTWSVSATISVRCVGGVRRYTSSGSYYFSAYWYGYADGAWGMQSRFASGSWTGFVGYVPSVGSLPWFGRLADPASMFIEVYGCPVSMSGTIGDATGLFPPVTGPISGCVQNFSPGGLTFDRSRFPWASFEDVATGRSFVPETQAAFAYTGTTTADNAAYGGLGMTQTSSFSWDLFAAYAADPPPTPPGIFVAGTGTQEYSLAVNLDVITPCDPDPCDLL